MRNSRKQIQKLQFFEQHPYCCFCGGEQITETQDHFPGRAIFIDRKWPEGYLFPACKACNLSSSDDELVMAVLSKAGPNTDKDPKYQKEFRQALHRLAMQNISLRGKFQINPRNQTKRILKELKIAPFDGYGEPCHTFDLPKEALQHAEKFGIKLAKALHYLHTKIIVPVNGHIQVKVLLNAEIHSLSLQAIAASLGGNVKTVRNTQPLINQFGYRYALKDDGSASFYFITFGLGTISFVAAVFTSKTEYLTWTELSQDIVDQAKFHST